MHQKSWIAGCLAVAISATALSAALPNPGAERDTLPDRDALRLEVDISERSLVVFHGDSRTEEFAVAVGEPEHPTPTGDFTIDRVIWNPGWVPPQVEWAEDESEKAPDDPDNPMQAAKLFFKYPDYYIHGTDAHGSIGEAASHGCIRMRPEDVERLGELVQEHGGSSRSDAWYAEVQRDDESDHEISLSEPVPVAIRP